MCVLSPNNVKKQNKTKQQKTKQQNCPITRNKEKRQQKTSSSIFLFLVLYLYFLRTAHVWVLHMYKYLQVCGGVGVYVLSRVYMCLWMCICVCAHVWIFAFLTCLEGFWKISALTSHNLSSGCRWRTWAGTLEQREPIIAFSLPAPSRKLTFNFLCDYPAYYQTGWWPASL